MPVDRTNDITQKARKTRPAASRITSLLLLLSMILSQVLAVPSARADEPPAQPAPAGETIDQGASQPPEADLSTTAAAESPEGTNRIFLTHVAYHPKAKGDWPMVAANPLRTSWTAAEVTGDLRPVWFKHFDAYISQKIQIIATEGSLFISAADGLHALDAGGGNERWFYPTAQPLGNSPTFDNGVLYVGGFDHLLHAIDARNGERLWTFQAGAGFQTNPVVGGGLVFLGNRDGYFYAVDAGSGELRWKYRTGGPILFSAALFDGSLYFVSNDNYAYALRANNGELLWRSEKLPGNGFYSYWPVVYQDYVVFPGSYNYRYVQPFSAPAPRLEKDSIWPNGADKGDPLGPIGSEPGEWIAGTRTIDASAVSQYYEQYPYRRTYMVLNRANGEEYTYDSDGDGRAEYAPIQWLGTHSGTRYPPVVGIDHVLYQSTPLYYDPYITRGKIVGWKFGTPYLSIPKGTGNAVDEPMAYAAGGDMIYWKRCCDRSAGGFEVNRDGGDAGSLRAWTYYDTGGKMLRRYIPELFADGWDFAYWKHGDQSPPIPYNGKVYVIANNAVVAMSPDGGGSVISTSTETGYTGKKASDIERGETAAGLNTSLTAGNNRWPLLIQQESYYAFDTGTGARGRWFDLAEVSAGPAAPSSLSRQDSNITSYFVSNYSGGRLQAWVSRRSPSTLFLNNSTQYRVNGTYTAIAYLSGGGAMIRRPGSIFSGAELSSGWLLAWDSSPSHRWSPLVISLEKRPAQISFTAAGLQISYPGPAGFLALTPLYGMQAPKSSETGTWLNGIPAQTVERVQLVDRLSHAFPSAVRETLSTAGNDVSLSFSYTYGQFSGDWGTQPLQVAYLPPSLALAAWNGSPIRIDGAPLEQQLDLNYVTPLGRLAGKASSAATTVLLPGLASYWREVQAPNAAVSPDGTLQAALADQVQKIIAAGHLLPGYGMVGIWEGRGNNRLGDDLPDYWKNPADTINTLVQALPWLPGDLQDATRAYLQREFQDYPVYRTAHAGWQNGTNRNFFDLPPEVASEKASFSADDATPFNNWGLPPQNLYALWQYASQFGDAAKLFDKAKDKLNNNLHFQASIPYVLDAYLAGYTGYLHLAQLAGAGPQPAYEKTLVDLLVMRAALSKYPSALQETGFEYGGYAWALRKFTPYESDTLFTAAIAGSLWSQMPLYGFPVDPVYGLAGASSGGDYAFGIDYLWLTPETAAFLRDYAPKEAAASIASYDQRAPYWFVAAAAETGGEGALQPIYDRWAYFQAHARILGESREQLIPYLDVPVVKVGDMYYIQNLVATLEAGQ